MLHLRNSALAEDNEVSVGWVTEPAVLASESCTCGAVFKTKTFTFISRAKEIEAFREAHRVCREGRVKTDSDPQGSHQDATSGGS
jgi:hypothetical protein